MMYLSKGILPWAPSPSEVSVSHCGVLHKLAAPQSALWLAGQFQPGHTKDNEQGAALWQLAGIGLVECGDTTDMASRFRLLANCAICPVRVKPSLFTLLRRDPREFILNSRALGLEVDPPRGPASDHSRADTFGRTRRTACSRASWR